MLEIYLMLKSLSGLTLKKLRFLRCSYANWSPNMRCVIHLQAAIWRALNTCGVIIGYRRIVWGRRQRGGIYRFTDHLVLYHANWTLKTIGVHENEVRIVNSALISVTLILKSMLCTFVSGSSSIVGRIINAHVDHVDIPWWYRSELYSCVS